MKFVPIFGLEFLDDAMESALLDQGLGGVDWYEIDASFFGVIDEGGS